MPVSHIPAGYRTLTPGCTLRGAAQAIQLYQQIFGARTRVRMDAPDGTVAHAELEFGDSLLMLGEASEQFPPHGARLMMYVADVDAVQWYLATHVEDVTEEEMKRRMAALYGG